MLTYISTMLRKDEGATALEYGILVALIAIVIVVGVSAFGNQLLAFFNGIGAKTGLIAGS